MATQTTTTQENDDDENGAMGMKDSRRMDFGIAWRVYVFVNLPFIKYDSIIMVGT